MLVEVTACDGHLTSSVSIIPDEFMRSEKNETRGSFRREIRKREIRKRERERERFEREREREEREREKYRCTHHLVWDLPD